MKSFRQFINEHFVNLIGDDPRKHQYAPEVFKVLQQSYVAQGGIHGNGFKDAHDMVKAIPMWKMKVRDGKVVAVAMYKDKEGRKAVAYGTNQSEDGKKHITDIMKQDLTSGRAYGEVSDRALSFIKKHVDLKPHIIPYDQVKHHLGDDEYRRPPENDPEVVRHPELKDHFYQRKIGNDWHTKVMIGQPGKKIR